MNKKLTMSNKMRRIFFGFLILLTGMAFAGCSNSSFDSGPETPQTGTGYFVLTNGIAEADTETLRAQTIMPGKPIVTDFASYELIFTPKGSNSNPQETVNRTSANLNNPVELSVGTWDLVVYAYKNVADAQPTAQGDLIGVIDIKSGGTTSGAVTLTTFVSGGTGTFSWNISYPSNVSAIMTIMYLNESPAQVPPITNGTPGSCTLDSGYYIVLVELTHNITNQTVKLRETLHIHRNITSSFTHTFTDINFFATLSATVSIEVQMGGPVDWTDPCVGETLVATVTPALPSGYNYQWYRGATPIGTNSATYTFATGDEGGPNNFSVTVICDGYNGSVTSSPLTLTVAEEPDGSNTKPFRIYDETDLRLVGRADSERPTWTLNNNYRLMRNITLMQGNWTPIGTNSIGFTGIFDGGNNTISDLTINSPTSDYLGLFSYIDGGTVKNLGLINVSITSSNSKYVGGLVGHMVGHNSGTIQNCYATGSATGDCASGLIASCASGTVQNCYATGSVTGYTTASGLIGSVNSSTIQNCYATGSVSLIIGVRYSSAGLTAGGLTNSLSYGTIQNCVTLSTTITRMDNSYLDLLDIGRVAGHNNSGTLSNNYAYNAMQAIGGFTFAGANVHDDLGGEDFPGWTGVGWTTFHSSKAAATAAVELDPEAWPWWWDGSGNPKLWFEEED